MARVLAPGGERVPVDPVEDQRWHRDGFALVDFEDGTGKCATGSPLTHTSVELDNDTLVTVTGVAFDIGVPEETNHLDAATSPAIRTTAASSACRPCATWP